MSRISILFLILALLIVSNLYFFNGDQVIDADLRVLAQGDRLRGHEELISVDSPPHEETHQQPKEYTLKATDFVFDPVAELRRRAAKPPYRIQGGGGTGRVVGQTGKVLIDSGEEIRILNAKTSPDHRYVLVIGGDAVNIILDPQTGERVELPVHPPGARMLGFGQWFWLASDQLLGISGVVALNGEMVSGMYCEEPHVVESKFYVFDLGIRTLSEVSLPHRVPPILAVPEVSMDGYVHLWHLGDQQEDAMDLGWWKVQSE